jgi:murein DD-endopeptidase MepM/ murein hydrolase activator NlpD
LSRRDEEVQQDLPMQVDTAVEQETVRELTRPLGGPPRRFKIGWLIVPLVLLGGGYLGWKFVPRIFSRIEKQPAPLLDADTQEAKEAIVSYLNSHVRVPDFHAEVHRVTRRESYWTIARKYHVNIDTVVGLNPELTGIVAKKIGYPLVMASTRGVLHQVAPGESLQEIASRFYSLEGVSVTARTIRQENAVSWWGLRPGQILFLPRAKPHEFTAPMAALYATRNTLRSPLGGGYTSHEGYRVDPFTGERRFHNGVDIRAKFNEYVGAAGDGVVESAGWAGGYGKCIILRHANGYKTLYGHLNAILVHVGKKVKQHQIIGRVGMTGRTTGPHLHFTVWLNGKLQDPTKYLW